MTKKLLQRKISAKQKGFTMLELLIAGVLLIIIIGVAVTQLLGKQNSEYRNQAVQAIGSDMVNALTTYYQQHQRTYTGLTLAYLTQNGFQDQNGNFTMPCSGADTVTTVTAAAQTVTVTYPFASCKSPATFASEVQKLVCPTAATCLPVVNSATVAGTSVTVVYGNPR